MSGANMGVNRAPTHQGGCRFLLCGTIKGHADRVSGVSVAPKPIRDMGFHTGRRLEEDVQQMPDTRKDEQGGEIPIRSGNVHGDGGEDGTDADSGLPPPTRELTYNQIAEAAQLFKEGWSMREVERHFNFKGYRDSLRDQFTRHGYRLTRMIVPVEVPRRTWGRLAEKLDPPELAQIDEWLDIDHYTLAMIVRLVRVRGIAKVYDQYQLDRVLFQSGYAWRYGVVAK